MLDSEKMVVKDETVDLSAQNPAPHSTLGSGPSASTLFAHDARYRHSGCASHVGVKHPDMPMRIQESHVSE